MVALPFFECQNGDLTLSLLCCTILRGWCLSSWMLSTSHLVRLRYRVVGHVTFMIGFCPLTDRYIRLWRWVHNIAQPFIRLWYRVVGHVTFMVGFCPLTNHYICLWRWVHNVAQPFIFVLVCSLYKFAVLPLDLRMTTIGTLIIRCSNTMHDMKHLTRCSCQSLYLL